MSTLTDRLRGVVQGTAPMGSDTRLTPTAARESLQNALGGEWDDEQTGFVVERRLEADARHGGARIGDLATQVLRAAADASLFTGGAPARAPFVFFDLETTGLSGGAGTHAFLVGCGWFDEDGAFVMRQHVLTEYGVERAMLGRVANEFLRAGAIVSFNGKSFDAPVLETRYLFHRLEWTGARLPHIDVLHPARRFWGTSGAGPRPSCSLIALEEDMLGVRRVGDVPGFEIPARYFQFIRSGDARPLAAVLEHNRLDLVSLAGFAARLLELARDGHDCAGTPWEALALGHLYARGGLDARARAAFEHAVEMSGTSMVHGCTSMVPLRVDALRMLATLLRRARQFDDAAACWRRLLDITSCPPAVAREANEALAIHHEHRVRDLAAAKMFAFALQRAGGAEDDAARHRLQRIERKIGKISSANGPPLFPSWPSSKPSLPPTLLPSFDSPTSGPRTSS
jgi:uncharacterized protein